MENSLDVKYKSKSTISKVFIIYDTGKVKEVEFTIKDEYLSVSFSSISVCSYTDYKVCIVDENNGQSDAYSFKYTYTCFPAKIKILTKDGYKNILVHNAKGPC